MTPRDPTTAAAAADSIRRAAARLATGAPLAAGGVWGSSYALIVLAVSEAANRGRVERAAIEPSLGPVIVVLPDAAGAESAADDLACFRGEPSDLFPESDAASVSFADRLRAARKLMAGEARVVVASARALLQPLPSPATAERTRLRLAAGDRLDLDLLSKRLAESRYERTHAVEVPGEYAIRGGILDLYPFTSDDPVRVELMGSQIESIRDFRIADQGATRELGCLDFSLMPLDDGATDEALLTDWLPKGGWIAVREAADVKDADLSSALAGKTVLTMQSLPVPERGSSINFRTLSMQRFSGALANVARELAEVAKGRDHVVLYSATEGEEERVRQLLQDSGVRNVELRRGRLATGFTFEEAGVAVLSNHELFNRYRVRRPTPRRAGARPIDTLLELEKGDTVVHLTHGIGRFLGLERLKRDGREQDFVAVEYQGGAKVYVPVANIDLIQKYVGGTDSAPPLHVLGGTRWTTDRLQAEESVRKLAQEMLRVQALRGLELGIAFPPDTEWQRAFEAAFPYEDTEDQVAVTAAIKKDMETPRPMDRLICGDVGYGKTELAMRAAFKAATSNKQVAVLVPTTVLAQQHYQTFSERMADYPLAIEVISRFKSKAEQRRLLKSAEQGKIDILIGTHRIVQPDVKFKDLGLVVIDEEQRFGVEHKEMLKRLRATVDVLTLTATPIPRTLHMSLLGIRDISSLATPPQDRIAIRTEVLAHDDRRIREALLAELDRGGQAYFVHNRVYSIEGVRRYLERIVPEASFGVAHGQMDEHELEATMLAFLDKRVDVLIATTIIESGLDIPNVNTILIDNADQFGLADLHQLRGRVGRYKVQARCLLLLPRDRQILPQARKRLKAIEEYSDLGSGYRIAMRDLEIRGVGNLLGREQHGHIAAVGYDLYLKMLDKEAKKQRKEAVEEPPETGVDIGVDASIPASYIGDLRSRVEAYRSVVGAEDLEAARAALADRFGPPPPEVDNFLKVVKVKHLASAWRLSSVALGRGYVVATYLDRKRAKQLEATNPREIRLVDDKAIHIYAEGNPSGAKLAEALIGLLTVDR